ncbi:hypothetical protein [Sphingomonas sp.]|uniref:hypothetical protein n=1 Tax=Sphingomonas sp. TaxID=28214 RepID=UPI003CC61C25
MHKVVVDRTHALVCMTADGFFGEADVEAAAADLHAAIRSLGDRAGRHVTLYDLAALKVAPTAVLAKFAHYFSDPSFAPLWACRVALVSTSPLVQLQMERVCAAKPNIRGFTGRREAIAWLLADHARVRVTSQPTVASA